MAIVCANRALRLSLDDRPPIAIFCRALKPLPPAPPPLADELPPVPDPLLDEPLLDSERQIHSISEKSY